MASNARRIGDAVVVTVAAEDGVDPARDVTRDREVVGDHPPRDARQTGPRDEGIDEEPRLRRLDDEAGGAEPRDARAPAVATALGPELALRTKARKEALVQGHDGR